MKIPSDDFRPLIDDFHTIRGHSSRPNRAFGYDQWAEGDRRMTASWNLPGLGRMAFRLANFRSARHDYALTVDTPDLRTIYELQRFGLNSRQLSRRDITADEIEMLWTNPGELDLRTFEASQRLAKKSGLYEPCPEDVGILRAVIGRRAQTLSSE